MTTTIDVIMDIMQVFLKIVEINANTIRRLEERIEVLEGSKCE